LIQIPAASKPPGADAAPRWFHIVVAVSMILSASAALVGSLRTSATMEAMLKQNTLLVQANATPLLEFESGNLNAKREAALSFELSNAGSGAARIVWFEASLDGLGIKNMAELIEKLQAAKHVDTGNITTSSPAPRMLPVGKEIVVFEWLYKNAKDATAGALWEALDAARQAGRIKARACYCSILDTCWVSNLDGGLPKPAASCEAIPHHKFVG
jgi:hypothetical protein